MNLFIFAMKSEVKDLFESPAIKRIKHPQVELYKLNNNLYLISKIGLVNASFSLTTIAQQYSINQIYNLGVVGCSNKNIPIGSIIFPNKIYYSFVDVREFDYDIGQIPAEPKFYINHKNKKIKELENLFYKKINFNLGSSDIFINNDYYSLIQKNFKNKINIFDMEAAALCQVANKLNIPTIIIKVISDYTTDTLINTASEFNKNLLIAQIKINKMVKLINK